MRSTFIVILVFVLTFAGKTATKTWTVTGGGSWATAGNWSPSGAPANGDDVIIPAQTGAAAITNVPTRTLNSLTFTGTGGCGFEAAASGNVMNITTSWLVPSGFTLTIGAPSARMVWTLLSTCSATLNGYCAFDAGNTNRNFTVNGTLIVNSTGILYDPNPTNGSDFYLTNGATLKTQKAQGITTVIATNAASVNYSVAVSFGGLYSYASGANYEYNGATGQITGTGLSQNTPGSVTVNLSGGNTLTLTANTTISGSLTLTSGKVNLNSNTLTLGTSASSVGLLTRTADYLFNGTFRRWFATAAIAIPSTSGLFPLGTSAGDYRPLWIGYTSNLTTAGIISAVHTATYPATFIAATHVDASWTNTLQGVSNAVWTIATSTLAFNGSTGAVRYGGTGFGSNTLTDLNASLAASVTGTHSAATNANTTIEVNRTNITSANVSNAWRIGTRNITASPLPITLVDFKAEKIGESIDLSWTTASEKNSAFFEIERAIDGLHFESIGRTKAAGNSNTLLNYELIDSFPLPSINYYRLKETDFDGKRSYSKIVSVSFENPTEEIYVYPNPSYNSINVFVKGEQRTCSSVDIFNSLGQRVYQSENCYEQMDLDHLGTGVYYLKINFTDRSEIKKFVLNK